MSGGFDAPLQVIVTSYQRPKYLRPCLQSIKEPGVEVYVVDGGSDGQTLEIINDHADDYHLMNGNPGADVLKNEGIQRFARPPYFIVTSDDFVFPPGWSQLVRQQFETLNRGGLRWAMVACPTHLVIERHTKEVGDGGGVGKHYHFDETGVEIMETSNAMVAGTIMDFESTFSVGGFPVYGKTGQGDIAIGAEFRARGWKVGYFRNPVINHIGGSKKTDYPAYTADFDADDEVYQRQARKHIVGSRRGF